MQSSSSELQAAVDPTVDHWTGAPTAAVTVVMYGDFECPFTRLAYRSLERMRPQLDDRLRLVFRHFPLVDKHPHAERAAETAEAAAAHGLYWPMHNLLFHRQKALEASDLRGYAEEVGLDLDRYDDAVANPTPLQQRVARDVESGIENGVHGTPRIFVDGVLYAGSREYEPFLEHLLAAS